MNRRLLLPALLSLLAAAPAPLVVGSVRDQEGAPIAGAVVAAGGIRTTTAADGTFALPANQVRAIEIRCTYCTPLTLRVQADEPVVAIVRRYQALANLGPSEHDLQVLPYAQAESAVSLRPFVVLSDSRGLLPGPRLSERGTSRQGGAILSDGIPDYDLVSNVSMLPAIPLFDLQRFTAAAPGDAFFYGDQAGGGIFSLSDLPQPRSDGFAIAGNDGAVRAAAANDATAYALAASANSVGQRAATSVELHAPVGADSLDLSILAARANLSPASVSIRHSLEGFRAQFQSVRNNAIQASLAADRAGYTTSFASHPLAARWNDLVAQISVESQGRILTFVEAGLRSSTGNYDALNLRIGGTVTQTHLDAGAETRSDRYVVRAGAGAYAIAYNGGPAGLSFPMNARAVAPSLFASYDLSAQWTLAIFAGDSFRLPTLLEAYGVAPSAGALALDRYTQLTQTLTYTDGQRLRLSVTAMNQRVSNLDNGPLRASGASLVWQIAPSIVLRAWTLYVDDRTQPYEPLLRFGGNAQPVTPGSVWLTYENPAGLRLDAIYRADLLDARLDRHFDASLSAPFADRLRWFVSTERRHDVRYVDAGIRFAGP